MAFQLAAIPLMGKLGVALKGLMGAKGATAAAGALKGGKLAAAKRFAGNALTKYMGPEGVTPGNLAMNFGPDAFFGAMAGMQTPGDLGDKLIAGTTAAAGGALGGVGAVSLIPGATKSQGLRMLGEFGGGYAGDTAGMAVGDALLRGKDKLSGGEGLTPFEKQQLAYEQQLRQQMMGQYGGDPFLADNGLG